MKAHPVIDLENMRLEMKSLSTIISTLTNRISALENKKTGEPQGYAPAIAQAYPDRLELEWRVKILSLVAEISTISGVSIADILSNSRTIGPSQMRQWVYFEAKEAGIPLAAIGRIIGRDHTSVMHGAAKEAERRAEKPPVQPVFKSVRAK